MTGASFSSLLQHNEGKGKTQSEPDFSQCLDPRLSRTPFWVPSQCDYPPAQGRFLPSGGACQLLSQHSTTAGFKLCTGFTLLMVSQHGSAVGGQTDLTWHHGVHLTSGQFSSCHLEVCLKNPYWGICADLVISMSPHPSFQNLASCYLCACHYFHPDFTIISLFLCFGLNCFRLLRFR